jgi:hypothetical protein
VCSSDLSPDFGFVFLEKQQHVPFWCFSSWQQH